MVPRAVVNYRSTKHLFTTVRNEKNMKTINYSSIGQKFITKDSQLAEFIVLSNYTFEQQVWVSKLKSLEIFKKMDSVPFDYQLKRAYKGNPDENKKPQEGKAVHISVDENTVIIAVYLQQHGASWVLAHTHKIDKKLFDSYRSVIVNNEEVLKLENENKAPVDFSLNLS